MATPTNLPASATAGQVLTAQYVNDLRGAFRIMQVIQGTTTTGINSTSATYADTALTATITPQSTDSKILVVWSQNVFSSASGTGANLRLLRGATTLVTTIDLCFGNASGSLAQHTFLRLDSPASVSALTYKTQFARNGGAGTITVQPNASPSTITLFEISA